MNKLDQKTANIIESALMKASIILAAIPESILGNLTAVHAEALMELEAASSTIARIEKTAEIEVGTIEVVETEPLTRELYVSPHKQRNLDREGDWAESCICCGKRLAKDHSLYVHMNENWECVHPSVDPDECKEKTGANTQGYFVIGNDCAKKMAGFTIKM